MESLVANPEGQAKAKAWGVLVECLGECRDNRSCRGAQVFAASWRLGQRCIVLSLIGFTLEL